MEIPNVKKGDIIKIGEGFNIQDAQITRVYTDEDKKKSIFCGDIEAVYFQNKLKGTKEDFIWGGDNWQFKNEGTGGLTVNIDHYDSRLRN